MINLKLLIQYFHFDILHFHTFLVIQIAVIFMKNRVNDSKQRRTASSSIVWTFDGMENRHDAEKAEGCMKMFCEFLREHVMKIINF